MSKLNLTRALRIKGPGGEIAALKGPGFSWVKPTASFNPEAGLGTPTLTLGPGNNDLTGPATGREAVVFGFDVTLPATPPTANLIMENGGGGRGIMVMARGAFMRFRFGSGGSGGNVATGGAVGGVKAGGITCMVDVPVADLPFDGGQHTLVWAIDPRTNLVRASLWVDGVPIFDYQPGGTVQSSQWTGGASGSFLTAHNTNINGETNYDAAWPVATGQMRVYLGAVI